MKTYVIILAQTFPKGHPDAGKPTGFGASVVQGLKIHTIRNNFDEWEKKIREVQRGNAILSVSVWEGKPYRSNQNEILRLDRDSSIAIQKLHSFDGDMAYFVGEKGNVLPVPLQELANNDGLSLNEWKGWFDNKTQLPMAIIHFTDFTYKL